MFDRIRRAGDAIQRTRTENRIKRSTNVHEGFSVDSHGSKRTLVSFGLYIREYRIALSRNENISIDDTNALKLRKHKVETGNIFRCEVLRFAFIKNLSVTIGRFHGTVYTYSRNVIERCSTQFWFFLFERLINYEYHFLQVTLLSPPFSPVVSRWKRNFKSLLFS